MFLPQQNMWRKCITLFFTIFFLIFFFLFSLIVVFALLWKANTSHLCSCQCAVSVLDLVGSSGLEPPTSRLSGECSNQLSYEPVVVEISRIELLTPCLQGRCSPSWAIPPRTSYSICYAFKRQPKNNNIIIYICQWFYYGFAIFFYNSATFFLIVVFCHIFTQKTAF